MNYTFIDIFVKHWSALLYFFNYVTPKSGGPEYWKNQINNFKIKKHYNSPC